MRKGVVIPLGGIVVIVISIVIVFVLTMSGADFTKRIVLKTEVVGSDMNEIEAIRKMLREAIPPIIQRSAYELAKESYGEPYWTLALPTNSSVKAELVEKINELLPKSQQAGTYDGRKIVWQPASIEIIDTDTQITAKGGQVFLFTDKNINLEARSNVTFEKTATSSFFRLFNVGKSIFTNPTYANIVNSNAVIATKATQLQAALTAGYPDLNFVITVSENSLVVQIKDPNSKAPITSQEMLNLGKTELFDQLTLSFYITPKERIVIPGKEDPVILRAGANCVLTPYLSDITVGLALGETYAIYIAEAVQTGETCTASTILTGDAIMENDKIYFIFVRSDTAWHGDYNP